MMQSTIHEATGDILLHDTSLGRWFGANGPLTWPPKSPDLSPSQCFIFLIIWRVWLTKGRRTIEKHFCSENCRLQSEDDTHRTFFRGTSSNYAVNRSLWSTVRTSVMVDWSRKFNILWLGRFKYKHLWQLWNNTAPRELRTPVTPWPGRV
jgi:hypothetical protein